MIHVLSEDISLISGIIWYQVRSWASQEALVVQNLPASVGDVGWTPGSGRSPGEGHGNPLQYSCLENPMDRGAWRATYSTQGCKESHMMKWLSTSGAWFPNIYALIGSTCSTSRVKAFKLQMVVQAPPSATAFSNYYLGPPGSKIVHMRVSRTCCLNNLGSVSLASSKQSEQNCQPFSLVAIFS